MSGLEAHIRRMYADIANYGGDFGDGVESGPYDPFVTVARRGLTPFERAGVSVAVLHWLNTTVDNSTWDVAVADFGPRVRRLLAAGLLDHEPLVRSAAESFLASESGFVSSLRPVYERVVRRWAADAEPGAAADGGE